MRESGRGVLRRRFCSCLISDALHGIYIFMKIVGCSIARFQGNGRAGGPTPRRAPTAGCARRGGSARAAARRGPFDEMSCADAKRVRRLNWAANK
ncbi:hypothetical protein X949_2222 [Burkholderia pseudomallei MSHR5609]|nr:hypothetical protein X949_2222 [Burkholderia pseudomallei MSHR5609]